MTFDTILYLAAIPFVFWLIVALIKKHAPQLTKNYVWKETASLAGLTYQGKSDNDAVLSGEYGGRRIQARTRIDVIVASRSSVDHYASVEVQLSAPWKNGTTIQREMYRDDPSEFFRNFTVSGPSDPLIDIAVTRNDVQQSLLDLVEATSTVKVHAGRLFFERKARFESPEELLDFLDTAVDIARILDEAVAPTLQDEEQRVEVVEEQPHHVH